MIGALLCLIGRHNLGRPVITFKMQGTRRLFTVTRRCSRCPAWKQVTSDGITVGRDQ